MTEAISKLFEQLDQTYAVSHSANGFELFQDGRPVAVYGMGTVGRDVFSLLTQRGVAVAQFLDKKASAGATWRGIPIRQPDDAAITQQDRADMRLVIGIFNAYVDVPVLIATLRAMGYEHIVTFLDLHHAFSRELGDRYWLTARAYYKGQHTVIAKAHALWADDKSRSLYESVLRLRLTGDYSALPPPDSDTQYFPKDIPAWSQPVRLIDCGAYDGDTIRQALGTNLRLEAIAAFEPDPENYVKLARFVAQQCATLPETLCLFPNGAYSCTEQLRFNAGAGTGSGFAAQGSTVVQCVSLDEALPGFRPNLIKMDIEGAEYAALWGARETIRRHRPGLAICLYHAPQHLWQIPWLVQNLGQGGYKLYLRLHCFNGFDLVMYAIP
jgi:FkbM family methyltransferase